jgi:hypothetical protein
VGVHRTPEHCPPALLAASTAVHVARQGVSSGTSGLRLTVDEALPSCSSHPGGTIARLQLDVASAAE